MGGYFMERDKNYFENRGKKILEMANIIASKFKVEEKNRRTKDNRVPKSC